MLNALIAASLRKPWLVLLMAGLLVVVSVRELARMPVEVFPELSAPTVTIMTEAPGYAAEEVETAVTFPVETAINGLPGLRRLRSSSTLSLSIVWAEFPWRRPRRFRLGRDCFRPGRNSEFPAVNSRFRI